MSALTMCPFQILRPHLRQLLSLEPSPEGAADLLHFSVKDPPRVEIGPGPLRLSLSRPLRSLCCLHGETRWSFFTLEAFSMPMMVYFHEHVSMNSQKEEDHMQLVQLHTRQKLLTNTTCSDTLPASDQINAHRPTNQSFLPAFLAPNLASRIVLIP